MSRYRAANDGVDRGVVMGGRGTHNWSLSWVGATLLATASIITVGGPVSSATATTTSSTVTVGIVPLENAAAVSEVTLLSGLVRTSASSHPVGQPSAVAVTPDGTTAYVTDLDYDEVTPINTSTLTPGTPIKVCVYPAAIAITPDGTTAWVVCEGSGSGTAALQPIDLSTGVAGTPLSFGGEPSYITISPDGATAYVGLFSGAVYPVDIAAATPTIGSAFTLPTGTSGAFGLGLSPNGATLYVSTIASATGTEVVPFNTSTHSAETPISLGETTGFPGQLAMSSDGKTAYVSDFNNGVVIPLNLVAGTAGSPITVEANPSPPVFSPDGTTIWVPGGFNAKSAIDVISVATNKVIESIPVGNAPSGIAFAKIPVSPTSTALSAHATSLLTGSKDALTATVTTSGTPGGTVTFYDSTKVLCSAVSLSTSAPFVASCDPAFTTAGAHDLTAVYSGDFATANSTSPVLKVTVSSLSSTTTRLTHSPTTPRAGHPVTFKASVSGGAVVPTGHVVFHFHSTHLTAPTCGGGDTKALSRGSASCVLAHGFAVSGSPFTIWVTYGGDSGHRASTSTTVRIAV